MVNAKLEEWSQLVQKCEKHREIKKECKGFNELLAMAPLDRELGAAVAHYKNSTPSNPPYTGCNFELQELAAKREAAAA